MKAKANKIKITSVHHVDWCIPFFGNRHYTPYGVLSVTGIVDGKEIKQNCKTHGDLHTDKSPYQYIIFCGQRFVVRNKGSLYNPDLYLERWHKQRVNGRLVYTEDYKEY